MKRVGNLYNEIIDLKKINKMYLKIKTNTKNKRKIENFENNYVSNTVYIKNILEKKNYKPGKYNIFIIREPKIRLIMSQNITDKIINHLVSQYFLVNIFEKTLINENIATRKNKGTHYGLKLLKKYLNNLKDKNFYVLKFDISKYFFNLDHQIIKDIIRKKIKDKEVLKILDNIIDSTNEEYINLEIKKQKEINKLDLPEYNKGKGLPIGNMSSQIIAIMYLNELDHYIKKNLKIKYYIRYMDDGILLHENKEYLEYCLKEIEKILNKYKLKLNNKTKIINIKNGFEFLGFRFFIKNNKVIMKVKTQTKKRFKRKIKKLNKLVDNKKIAREVLKQVQDSYIGHLKHGNTNNLIYKTIKKYEQKLKVKKVIIEGNKLFYKDEIIIYK